MLRFRSRQACPYILDAQIRHYSTSSCSTSRRIWLSAQPLLLACPARATTPDRLHPNLTLRSDALPGQCRCASQQPRRRIKTQPVKIKRREEERREIKRLKKKERDVEKKTSPETIQAVFQEFKQWIAESQAGILEGSPLVEGLQKDEQGTAGEAVIEGDNDGTKSESEDPAQPDGEKEETNASQDQPKKRGLTKADMLRLKKELALLDQLTEDKDPRTAQSGTPTRQAYFSRAEMDTLRAHLDTVADEAVPDEDVTKKTKGRKKGKAEKTLLEQTLFIARHVLEQQDVVLSKSKQDKQKEKQSAEKDATAHEALIAGINLGGFYSAPKAGKVAKKAALIAGVNLGDALAGPKLPSQDQAEARERKKRVKTTRDSTRDGARDGARDGTRKPVPVLSILSDSLRLKPADVSWEGREPPRLSYNLDRALFNPGIYHLQDPRSRVFNFDPYLAKIMPIEEFDFQALKSYVTSSKDNKLINIAAEYGKKYCGSTSSMTSTLSHFHYLISNWRPISFQNLSRGFVPESIRFTEISRAPTAAFLQWRDGVYAIDSDKEFDNATVLSMLGKSMEKLLTLPKDDFEKYRRSRSHTLTEEEKNADEVYNYSTLGDFMMRSQLDAMDPRLPGSGIFDLKTRACLSVRMDAQDFMNRRDYEIRDRFGQYESYEREFFDLIRSAFMKYSLQVRMGRMDGIFLAYHNTQRIFGFQYIPLTEMDASLHGTANTALGDKEFMLSLQLLNKILDKVTAKFHGRSIRLHVETRESKNEAFMYVFAQPVTESQVSAVQDANARAVQEFEEKMLGIHRKSPAEDVVEKVEENEDLEESTEEDAEESGYDVLERELAENEEAAEERESVWSEIMRQVEDSIENEEQGIDYVRDAIRTALKQSGLFRDPGAWPADDVDKYVDSLLDALTRDDGTLSREEDRASDEEPEEQQAIASELQQDSSESVETEASSPLSASSPEEMTSMAEKLAGKMATGNEVLSVALPEASDSEAETADAGPDSDLSEESLAAEQGSTVLEADVAEKDGSGGGGGGDGGDALQSTGGTDSAVVFAQGREPSTAQSPTLKDLILKVAEKIDPHTYDDVAHEMEDVEKLEVSKLAEFERLLSQLVAKSKASDETVQNDEKSGNKAESEDSFLRRGDSTVAPEVSLPSLLGSMRTRLEPTIIPTGNELMGLTITVRNKQDGKYVNRVTMKDNDAFLNWELEYRIEEMEPDRAARLYQNLLKRRYSTFGLDDDRSSNWTDNYGRRMLELSQNGRRYRRRQDLIDCKKPVYQWTEGGGKKYKFTDFWDIPRKVWSEPRELESSRGMDKEKDKDKTKRMKKAGKKEK